LSANRPVSKRAGVFCAATVAVEAARVEGKKVGQAEAIARIRSILGCEDAKGRETQALVLALETVMNAEDTAKVLAASPKAASGVASIAERAAGQAEMAY
jgi:hypothetical protein